MRPKSFMLIAGEASGDLLAAEVVGALRQRVVAESSDSTMDVQPLRTALSPRFFGAGGPRMAGAGVELAFDLTKHSVIGISEVFKKYFEFRRLFNQLLKLAIDRQPDFIIGVDYGGFNLRFGHAIRKHVRKHRSAFNNWNPKIVQFVSPQVWASRPKRAYQLQDDYDLLLSIFPFEKDWYAKRVPKLRVEFVGHPMVERNSKFQIPNSNERKVDLKIVLLPGSRADELRRHLPVVLEAFARIKVEIPSARATMVLPSEKAAQHVRKLGVPSHITLQVGDLALALADADLAITKSGTITLECAAAGVPAVVFYKTSWPTYLIGKQIVTVKFIAMPNLLAGESVYPEFIQQDATPEKIAAAALAILRDETRRSVVKNKLVQVVASLGKTGATERAAEAILSLSR